MALDPLRVALWRFEQISPLLEPGLSGKQRSELVLALSQRDMQWPTRSLRPVTRSTLYHWLRLYRANPRIDSLLPVPRTPASKRTAMKPEWVEYALGLIEQQADRSLYILSNRIAARFSLETPPSRSSLHRALQRERRYNLARNPAMRKRRVRFVATQVHQIWHGDAKAAFSVRFMDGSKQEARVLSLLDDCSRYILAALIVKGESLSAAVRTFRSATERFGLPEAFYADRGSAYDSDVFRQGLALLGVRRINTKPRNPSAHGKIEAYHRSLHRWFIKELPHQPVRDILHLQQLLDGVIHGLYHTHHHRELKQSPAAAFNNAISPRHVPLQRLHEAFLERHCLLPEMKTGNVRLAGNLFRIPSAHLLPRRRLTCAVDVTDTTVAYLVIDNAHLLKLEPAVKRAQQRLSQTSLALPAGSLSPLIEMLRGRTLQQAAAGFGLPEVYHALARVTGRQVPQTDSEAVMVANWLRRYGPFEPQAFDTALNNTLKMLGHGRALSSILEQLTRLIDQKAK
jgi:putative transposase